MTNSNAGEYADYTLSFTSPTGFAVTDHLVINFPDDFDPFVGYAS